MVRNPDSRPAQALTNFGVALNVGDWDDEAALTAGVGGCDMLFLTLVSNYRDLDDEPAGVKHVVYTSVVIADAPERRTLLPADRPRCKGLFCKNIIDGLVQRAGFEQWTIVRPGFFMPNLLDPKARMYHELFERNTYAGWKRPTPSSLPLRQPRD
ncbi:hypothetical protein QBC33DRAFT_558850 [Phialemonium atrogriseum]|uniref:NmrA-like domain-containing protein n=1 Tax=Phialemonium atrogriseum TaxID=1093897 RepID=A0AAJ0FG88_9PEZI|nr:uncharacterized protein QBC33DRAFT_558850 [Phialemonium atrogriseum]KAK1767366.1 hypothetical protein QBC33DRAFT_558850 [Phialemonium atrogriseum]